MSANAVRRNLVTGLGALAMATLAGGCGFRMRGPRPLAFKTLYVGLDANSELGSALRRRVLTSGTTVVVDDPVKPREINGTFQAR